jgi:ketosteroid isomerase-like protein
MRRMLLAPVALILVACQSAPEASDPAADEVAVRAILQGLEATWNAGNLDANAQYLDSDLVTIRPGEPAFIGEAANRQDYEDFLAANDDEWHPLPERIWVSGDLAVAWGRVTSIGGPKGQDATEQAGKSVWAFRRGEDRVWRMFLESWSPDATN